MTNELRTLKEKIEQMIIDAEICDVQRYYDYCDDAFFANSKTYKEDKLQAIDYNYILLSEVLRNNGTNENTSIRITINSSTDNISNLILRVKLSVKDSNKKVERLVNQVIDTYRNLMK